MAAQPIAPELPATLQWLNVQQAPALDKLRGRVVLLHFFNAANVNSLHLLQELRVVEARHHDGLSVIGIHVPKFDHERLPANVLKAVNQWHMRHPVANDADWTAWRQFGIQAWPSVAVIDAEGRIAGVLAGEGQRDQIESLVAHLLDDAANRDIRFYEPMQPVSRPEPRTPLRFPSKLLATETALFVADSGHNRVLECSHDGRVIRQIGTGTAGYLDGPYGDAAFNGPQGMALIKDMLYVADRGNHCIRRVHMITGEVDTMAGTGVHGRPATQDYPEPRQVALNSPWALAAAGEKLLIAMAGQHQIWSLDLSRKRLNLYSGTGKIGRDDGDVGMGAVERRAAFPAYPAAVLGTLQRGSEGARRGGAPRPGRPGEQPGVGHRGGVGSGVAERADGLRLSDDVVPDAHPLASRRPASAGMPCSRVTISVCSRAGGWVPSTTR